MPAAFSKNLGLLIGRAKFNVFAMRAEELIEGRPELIAAIRPLPEARNAVEQQVSELDWTGRISKCGDAMLRSYCLKQPGFG
jgi:transposase